MLISERSTHAQHEATDAHILSLCLFGCCTCTRLRSIVFHLPSEFVIVSITMCLFAHAMPFHSSLLAIENVPQCIHISHLNFTKWMHIPAHWYGIQIHRNGACAEAIHMTEAAWLQMQLKIRIHIHEMFHIELLNDLMSKFPPVMKTNIRLNQNTANSFRFLSVCFLFFLLIRSCSSARY